MNICHRDLKMENVLVFSNYLLKIADYGFSKRITANTVCDERCGTKNYMPPEIITCREG